jgi:hypothetical protein
MAKVNLMTQAEYAKHRGCSAVAVHKAVKAGRISLIDGKIDPAVADIQWKNNTRSRIMTGRVAASEPAAPELPLAAEPADGEPAEPGGDGGGVEDGRGSLDPQYEKSRSSREEAENRRAWLRLQEEEGQLVRIDQVRAELAAKLAPVREGLLQIPARLAPLLAPQSDPGRIQTLLEVEIHQVLAPLSKSIEFAVTAEAKPA